MLSFELFNEKPRRNREIAKGPDKQELTHHDSETEVEQDHYPQADRAPPVRSRTA
jgi:hypothetical protein